MLDRLKSAIAGLARFLLGAIIVAGVIAGLTGHVQLALGLAILACLLWGLIILRSDEGMRNGIQGLAAALSSIALLIGAYWYFIERRGVPKVNVEPSGQAWPVGDGSLLVRAAIKVSNVGVSAVRLDKKTPVEVEIGQVFPPAGKQATALSKAMQDGIAAGKKDFGLEQTDKWPLRAANYDGIEAVIEAGETENLYYKAIIPCQDDMELAITAKVPKRLGRLDQMFEPSKQQNYWVAQEIISVEGNCKGEGS
jgi:hypothetical protein